MNEAVCGLPATGLLSDWSYGDLQISPPGPREKEAGEIYNLDGVKENLPEETFIVMLEVREGTAFWAFGKLTLLTGGEQRLPLQEVIYLSSLYTLNTCPRSLLDFIIFFVK